MEKESKVKISRTSATAKNTNAINIKVVVGDQGKKKRVRRKPKMVVPAPPPVIQNVVQLPPTEVAVPNVTFGRPQYNFAEPRPYDSPDAGGMRISTFPELMQNYQARQEMMGMPPAQPEQMVQTAEGAPVEQAPVEAATQVAPETEEMGTQPEPEPEVYKRSDEIRESLLAIPVDSEGMPRYGYKAQWKRLSDAYQDALMEESGFVVPPRRSRQRSYNPPELDLD